MTLDNVERVTAMSAERLFREYALAGRPVILTSLLAGQPIAELGDLASAREAIGHVRLTFRGEYTRGLLQRIGGEPISPRAQLPFDVYWQHVGHRPETELMCIEEPTPPAVARLAPPPPLCTDPGGAPDLDMKSNMFVGNAGNHASLHFDGDCRHVLLYQVFGTKRVVVIPIDRSAALDPVANFAALALQHLTEREKHGLLERLGAWDTVIRPGEAILMPALVYHYVEYLDHGMSVSFRFGRRREHAFVSQHLHLDRFVQRVVGATLDGERRWDAVWSRIREAYVEPAPTRFLKYLEMRALFEALSAELGADHDAERADAREIWRQWPQAMVALPEAVRAYLVRAHLFNEHLYRHRERLSLSDLAMGGAGIDGPHQRERPQVALHAAEL